MAAVSTMKWPDAGLVNMLARGADPLGPCKSAGIFRPKATRATGSIAELLAKHKAALEALDSLRPPSEEQAAAVLECTLEEIEMVFSRPSNQQRS